MPRPCRRLHPRCGCWDGAFRFRQLGHDVGLDILRVPRREREAPHSVSLQAEREGMGRGEPRRGAWPPTRARLGAAKWRPGTGARAGSCL